jgi:tryptophan synthase beta chain
MSDRIKFFWKKVKCRKTWYNIAADLPKPLSPPLHPEH